MPLHIIGENRYIMKVSVLAMFTTFAVVLSYVESLIPIVGIPGAKLGLANLAIVLVLFFFSVRDAVLVSIVRIFIVGAMFGNLFSIAYSLAGALFSLVAMTIFKKTGRFQIPAISVIGAVFHNIGQLMVAALVVDNYSVIYYLPILFVVGIITGVLIGIVAEIIYVRTSSYIMKIL